MKTTLLPLIFSVAVVGALLTLPAPAPALAATTSLTWTTQTQDWYLSTALLEPLDDYGVPLVSHPNGVISGSWEWYCATGVAPTYNVAIDSVYYECYEPSNPPTYTTDATFHGSFVPSASHGNDVFNPGELVTVNADAGTGDQGYNPNTRGLNAITCFFFGCSSRTPPWVRVNSYFNGGMIAECADTGGCASTVSFNAPTSATYPKTYPITFIGQSQTQTGNSSPLYITVTGPTASTPPPPAATAFVTVTVAPSVTLNVSPLQVPSGGSSNLSYTSVNATSCTGSINTVNVGTLPTAFPDTGTWNTGPLKEDTTYSVTCTGPGGSATQEAKVTVPNINLYFTAP